MTNKSTLSSTTKKILIMAGGTGGHIFPALAIANELKNHSAKVEWLGSNRGMENTLVPKHGITLHTVSAVGLRGKSILNLIKAPFLLSLALFQTIKIFIKLKPDVALGMGGFASGIGGVIAWVFRVPLIIHEQNSIPGTTNKFLSKIAIQTFQAFDNSFNQSVNAITSGNPVLFKPKKKTSANKKLNLLIIGGSLGSKPINDVVTNLNISINIWHQTGKLHLDAVKSQYRRSTAKVDDFIEDMAKAYAWADLVLCRAGAMTISELMLSGTASILIPLPHAIDNHQFYNARILAKNNAGVLIEQKNLDTQLLEKTILELNTKTINSMNKNALKLAKPNAAKQISEFILDL